MRAVDDYTLVHVMDRLELSSISFPYFFFSLSLLLCPAIISSAALHGKTPHHPSLAPQCQRERRNGRMWRLFIHSSSPFPPLCVCSKLNRVHRYQLLFCLFGGCFLPPRVRITQRHVQLHAFYSLDDNEQTNKHEERKKQTV